MDGKQPEGVGSTLPDFSAGLRIAGYRLEEQVGKGGMAVVFRGVPSGGRAARPTGSTEGHVCGTGGR